MSTKDGDRSFQQFVESDAAAESQEVKSRAVAFVEGFNAADAAQVSVQWLIDSRKADEAIAGGHSYRMIDGYGEIVARLAERVEKGACDLRLGKPIRAIRWRRGGVTLVARDGETFEARRAVIAVPLGVLKAPADTSGGITFDPDITRKRSAMTKIAVGTVIRIVLVFRERFWERLERCGRPLSGLSFLVSNDDWFPTWWSTMPALSPILTGWAAGRRGERLSGKDEGLIVAQAITSLAGLLDVERAHLASMLDKPYLHDWQADPFSRGAYSYVMVGGASAPRELAVPLGGTLFFAGEATDTGGHNGTVHGAIASGRRAAQDVLASFER
jgi:monoamine oxidase